MKLWIFHEGLFTCVDVIVYQKIKPVKSRPLVEHNFKRIQCKEFGYFSEVFWMNGKMFWRDKPCQLFCFLVENKMDEVMCDVW